MTEDSRYIEKIPNRSMTHTDTDIAEILERFDSLGDSFNWEDWRRCPMCGFERETIKDFIARECLALKKKWEREHFDNQDERG